MPQKPVFFDPRGRRAKATNVMLGLAGVMSGLTVAGLIAALVMQPELVALPDSNLPTAQAAPESFVMRSDQNEIAFSRLRARPLPSAGQRSTRFGFISSFDERSFDSLKRNGAELDAIIGDWLLLKDAAGTLHRPEVQRENEIAAWLAAEARHLKVYPVLRSPLPAAETAAVLSVPARRTKLVAELTEYLRASGAAGLVVSFPHLPATAQPAFIRFLADLRRTIRPEGRQVVVMAPPDERSLPRPLVEAADFVLVNTHDRVRQTGGPIVGQGWFEAEVLRALRLVPREKLIIAVGSFAEDFRKSQVQRLSVSSAWAMMTNAEAKLGFDPVSLNSGFAYRSPEGELHEVWLLDGVTVFNHMRAALAANPAGVALWQLGLEDQGAWAAFGRTRLPDASAVEALQRLAPSTDAALGAAHAMVLRLKPDEGRRTVTFDAGLGLIVGQAVETLPAAAEVATWGTGGPGRMIALTFDDGPDPRYTPQILDMLKRYNAKASFFVIGGRAVRHPDLMRRIRDEGHDIGNHSFSHPDMTNMSTAEIELELTATQRVLETVVGVRSVLFRPTYYYKGYETEPVAAPVLDIASRLGYVTVRVSIDPNDWAVKTPAQIRNEVVTGALAGGSVVLLHDAGGSRASTVAALPGIIETLQREGYRFVTVHELLGLARDDVMPPASGDDAVASAIGVATWLGITVLNWTAGYLPAIAIGASILGVLRLLAIIRFAYAHAETERRRAGLRWRPASIAVIVPAFNEETVICKTIRSLAKFDGDIAILVIDDGSSDRTAEVVREAFASDPRVAVHVRANAGKAAALNYGLSLTKADIVVALDADTIFDERAIELLVRHFVDPSVGAVAGTAVVGNPVSLIARFQALEYITSQNLDRRAFERFNAIGVVPGAIGAWRRSALEEVGGFPHDTLAEDADLTIAIERRGLKVLYEPGAAALTEAPETLRAFLKQRFRWMFGTLQVAFKHRAAVLARPPCGIGVITLPNIVLFQFGFTLLAPVMDAMLILSILISMHEWLLSSGSQLPESLLLLGAFWMLFQTIDMAAAALAMRLERLPGCWRLLPLVLLQRFCYRQLLYVVAIRTLLAAIKGQFVGWGKLLRTASVVESERGRGDQKEVGLV